ncbi:hypothetical protein FRC20_008668 [Serendipita sp. 405]|nr:hypothetical protein FRC15_008656 [Serendipita sp. 397]KAG8866384.1 hypothetical protein FRC20_008668 [Serendipita sp. 405]
MTSRLPVELWQEIVSYALVIRILPSQGATLFEDLDVFAHPCKINHYLVSARASLRLVCRLWNEIVLLEGDRNYCAFTEAGTRDVFDFDTVRYAHRLEFIKSLQSYCRRWPCRPRHDKTERCPPMLHPDIRMDPRAGEILVSGDWPLNIQVVRFIRDVRDPTKLLQCSKNLKALSTPFTSFKTLDEIAALSIVQSHLSHLYLDNIYDNGRGIIHALHLPHLRYLELHFRLLPIYRYPAFPLDISMPNVATIFLHGSAINDYAYSIERLIMSSKETLVNLLISYNNYGQEDSQIFPLENLVQFPRLSTLGFSILSLRFPGPDAFCTLPLLTTTSLTLLLLDIEIHSSKSEWSQRKTCASRCIEMFARPSTCFSGISVPLGWSELEDLWVQACKIPDRMGGYSQDDHDPLPCYWSVLDRVSQYGISIRDRNAVGLWEGEGAKLAERMKALARSD